MIFARSAMALLKLPVLSPQPGLSHVKTANPFRRKISIPRESDVHIWQVQFPIVWCQAAPTDFSLNKQ
jgi:hypothetical protein